MLFSKPKKAIGLDIGSHSVKAVQMSRRGGSLFVEDAGYALVDRRQLSDEPVQAQVQAVRQALAHLALENSAVVCALQGQTVVIRYPRLPETARGQLDAAVQAEAGRNIPYDLSEVYVDWALLEETQGPDQKQLKVLLVAAKHEVIDGRVQVLDAASLPFAILSVDSLALADAAEQCQLLRPQETVALINIGLNSVSIHFVKDGVSNFIRDVNWGARELISAIAKESRIDFEAAEAQLQEIEDRAHEEGQPDAFDAAGLEEPDPFAEPATPSANLLDPLDDEDFSPMPARPEAAPAFGARRDTREILAVPLMRLVSEIRRSFDYYEHQLYERPVDRILLSGGISGLPIMRQTLLEELGVEGVEVCDPSRSALSIGPVDAQGEFARHPEKFMVAVGLAARGTESL